MLKFLILIIFAFNAFSRENISAFSYSEKSSIRIIGAGDVMAHMGQVKSALNPDGTYDFNRTFQFVKKYIDSADLAFCNFETVLGDKPYTGFPAFSSPDTLIYAVKYAGFDFAFTANNHCLDRGNSGAIKTIKKILKAELITSGTFIDSNDKKHRNIIYFTKNGIKVAFLNYTYGTNGFQAKPPLIVNYINKEEIVKSIKIAKDNKSDAIVVFFHWGVEYQRQPNSEQKEIAKLCYENGADAIIGAHPHVVQPISYFKFNQNGKQKDILIAYSLGNLASNQYWRYSDGGIFIDFTINKDEKGEITFSNVNYKPVYVYKNYSSNKKNYFLIFPENLDDYKFKFSKDDIKKINEFYNDTKSLIGEINK